MVIPVEQRFPFLDFRMVELGLQMPIQYLFRNGWSKYILRKAMASFLPKKILWRKRKMGFPFPHYRFLDENRFRLESFYMTAKNLGYAQSTGNYESMLAIDPFKLWRTISTGIWFIHAMSPNPPKSDS